MNFVEECPACQRLSGQYEAATMEWFRVQNQLGIAEHLRDREASERIVSQLAAIAKRRQALRDQTNEHLAQSHPSQAAGAS